MRRRAGIAATAVAIALIATALAHGEVRQLGDLRVSFNGGFAPQALPRDRAVPVTLSVDGRISTTDGSHPPSLRRFELEFNRAGKITTVGLATCSAPQLQSTTSAEALAQCRPALVGEGSFAADVTASDNPIPARGRILVFNTESRGKPALLLHLYGTVPIQVTIVLPLEIQRLAQGKFGTRMVTPVPKLAGGIAAITNLSLDVGRTYTYRGKRLGYLSASCAAPAGFPGAPFPFARASFRFADERVLTIALTRNCKVRD
ncbi:MAG TPA: hypothetical protein VHR18_09835 [Solirubrobacterales bacterium]|jgi:hypothetical protein|nr:hypothetical protein [Solirubrobacterales bacterium]